MGITRKRVGVIHAGGMAPGFVRRCLERDVFHAVCLENNAKIQTAATPLDPIVIPTAKQTAGSRSDQEGVLLLATRGVDGRAVLKDLVRKLISSFHNFTGQFRRKSSNVSHLKFRYGTLNNGNR